MGINKNIGLVSRSHGNGRGIDKNKIVTAFHTKLRSKRHSLRMVFANEVKHSQYVRLPRRFVPRNNMNASSYQASR